MDCYLTRIVAHLRRASLRPNRRFQGQQFRHGKRDLARRVELGTTKTASACALLRQRE